MKPIYKKLSLGILIVSIPIFLTGCGEEKKAVAKAKEDFKVLYTYDEDRIRPVLEEEKSTEELAEEYLMSRMGMNEGEPTYSERGVLENQGVFVESGIYEGTKIPNVSALSEEDRKKAQENNQDVFAEEKADEYDELKKERQKVIDNQYAEDNSEREYIEDEINRQVKEFQQDSGKDIKKEKEKKDDDLEDYDFSYQGDE